jgi:hypothetical protein
LRLSALGPQTVIRWGRRLLYVMLFISLVMVYGNWDNPQTIPFLGATLSLIITFLFFLQDENWEDTNGHTQEEKIGLRR